MSIDGVDRTTLSKNLADSLFERKLALFLLNLINEAIEVFSQQ